MKWITAWQLIKDIALTGTGLLLIVLQVFSRATVRPAAGHRPRPHHPERRVTRWHAALTAVHGHTWAACVTGVIVAAWLAAAAAIIVTGGGIW